MICGVFAVKVLQVFPAKRQPFDKLLYCFWESVIMPVIRQTSLSPGSCSQMLKMASPPLLCRPWGAARVLEKSKRMLTTWRTPPGPVRLVSTAAPSTSLSPSLPHWEIPPSYPVSVIVVVGENEGGSRKLLKIVAQRNGMHHAHAHVIILFCSPLQYIVMLSLMFVCNHTDMLTQVDCQSQCSQGCLAKGGGALEQGTEPLRCSLAPLRSSFLPLSPLHSCMFTGPVGPVCDM